VHKEEEEEETGTKKVPSISISVGGENSTCTFH
jgi:hypothetical protein